MRKPMIQGIAVFSLLALLAGCGNNAEISSDTGSVLPAPAESSILEPAQTGGESSPVTDADLSDITESAAAIPQTGWTTAVPSSYTTPASQQGSVVPLTYDTKDYARDSAPIQKTAYVYLPYGYDDNETETQYNILYLMHGWGGHAGEYFEFASQKNMFDNLIENGDIAPMIIVSASFYTENSSTDFSGSIREFRAFHSDFENGLMPAVEGKYHTYAASASEEDLKASRDHRAFGGFSLGSVTTWLQFCYDYDYIRYFLPMSGSCWYYGTYGDFQIEKNVDFIEQLIKNNDLEDRGYFIYHAVGTNDAVKSQSLDMADEMLSRGTFTADHYVFYQKEGGYHDFNAVQEYLYNALPLFFKDNSYREVSKMEINADTEIQDIINNPLFEDFGRLLFPTDSGYYRGDTLGNLSLTWYDKPDTDKTVEIVSSLQERAAAGEKIFYSIYSDEEIAADPSKADTGLFYFKGRPGEKFAICNAGGGMVFVGAMQDSFPHALELSKMGYNAFALIYRPGYDTAPADLARAIAYIFEHAEELEVDTSCYSLWGGSAGARMAAWLGSYGTAAYGEADYPQAGAVIMQYTGLTEVTGNEPPTYNYVGTRDGIASYRTMQERIDRISANGTDAMIEIFDGLPHGFGLGIGTVAEGWINNAAAFWERQMPH